MSNQILKERDYEIQSTWQERTSGLRSGSRHYDLWRRVGMGITQGGSGFAKWRRAINGFGETPTPKDLSEDLTEAESEFDAALQRDPGFVDAKVGAASCLFNRLFLEGVFKNEKDPQRLREILAPASLLLKDAKTLAPDNPRLLWVVGPNQWNTPPERGPR